VIFQAVPGTPQPQHIHITLDVIDKAVKITAVLIGASWTYLNYVRGRTFKKRLELKICGKTTGTSGTLLLSGSAQLKNVGLSKVAIEQQGTGILVYDLKATSRIVSEPTPPTEERTVVQTVFKDHGWIEPGETIEESFLLQLPKEKERIGIKLELRIVAAHIEWNANSIVEMADPSSEDVIQISKPECGSQSMTGGSQVPSAEQRAKGP
jgi:hypothetical protein